MKNNQLPSIEQMHAFVHSDRVLLEVAINVILLDRDQRFKDGDAFLDAFVDIEEQLSGIIFEEIKLKFGVSDDNEPFEVLMQQFFSRSIFTVTRKRFNAPSEVCSFMEALPFSFPGSLNAFVSDAYREYRLNGVYRDNHFAYSLKHTLNEAILDGHPDSIELYKFLTDYAFTHYLNNR